jgi:hypothetical protein
MCRRDHVCDPFAGHAVDEDVPFPFLEFVTAGTAQVDRGSLGYEFLVHRGKADGITDRAFEHDETADIGVRTVVH